MKALSLRPEWAMPVFLGWKTVECRTWKTDYRGPLLICSSSKKCPMTIAGHALAVVELVDVQPFRRKHLEAALMDPEDMPETTAWAWVFDAGKLRWVYPFEVKGKLHLFDVDDALIKVIPNEISSKQAVEKHFEPLMSWTARGVPEAETRAEWDQIKAAFEDQ